MITSNLGWSWSTFGSGGGGWIGPRHRMSMRHEGDMKTTGDS